MTYLRNGLHGGEGQQERSAQIEATHYESVTESSVREMDDELKAGQADEPDKVMQLCARAAGTAARRANSTRGRAKLKEPLRLREAGREVAAAAAGGAMGKKGGAQTRRNAVGLFGRVAVDQVERA